MRIAQVIESKNQSGPNTVARKLAQAFASDSRVVTPNIYTLKGFISAVIDLPRWNVYQFYSQTFTALVLMFLAKLFRVKIIYVLHGDLRSELSSKPWWKKVLWLPIHQVIFYFANKIITPSNFTATVNRDLLPDKLAIKVIPNPYDFVLQDVRNLPMPVNMKKLIIVSSFNLPQKAEGIAELIEAVAELNVAGSDLKLQVLGRGKLLEQFRNQYKYEWLELSGYRLDSVELIKASSLMTYLTKLDNQPMVILEAVANGIPVIASNTGGISDMLPADYIIDTKLQLQELIKKLTTDKDAYLKARIAQYELASKKFNFSEVAAEYMREWLSV